MHNALLQLSGDKMSKSVGNLVTIAEALESFGGDALRMFVITSHYRSPSSYTDEAMDAAKAGVERLRNAAFRTGAAGGEVLDPGATRSTFIEAPVGGRVGLELAVDRLREALLEELVHVAGEERIPVAAPQDLELVPPGARDPTLA